jgi:2-hydroxychromene-2-carboxylate isomerase
MDLPSPIWPSKALDQSLDRSTRRANCCSRLFGPTLAWLALVRDNLADDRARGARMTTPQIDFWFTMGSTHSFLSVMRLAEVERSSGVSFRWHPFHLLVILQEMKHVPFADKPVKSAYMWRDIERRAAMYGFLAHLPAPYPAKQSVVANLIATVGMREGWGADFVRAAYRRWFQLGQETGSEPNISESLREIDQDPERVLKLAAHDEVKAMLTAETDAARAFGIFGSPTFTVGRELFWGDDRLDDAISWYKFGRVQRPNP